MGYTVRFESSAFQADSSIQRLLDFTTKLGGQLRNVAGVTVDQKDVDNLRKLYGVNARVFEQAMDWADQDFDEQINAIKWDWKGTSGETRRKNGERVTEPRNIVDTGELLRSKQRRDSGRSSAEFEWTAQHAEGVHDGYVAKSGAIIPARPWTEPTLQEIDGIIEGLINQNLR